MCFFVLAARQHMRDPRSRTAGGIDDDFNMPVADQRVGIVGDMRVTTDIRLFEILRRELPLLPADPPQRFGRAGRVEIGDTEQMNTGRAGNLRKIHRAEFPGTNQADSHRIADGDALLQEPIKIHSFSSSTRNKLQLSIVPQPCCISLLNCA